MYKIRIFHLKFNIQNSHHLPVTCDGGKEKDKTKQNPTDVEIRRKAWVLIVNFSVVR